MNKICVLIRVYNRVEDLKYCIDIIRDTWNHHQYFIMVVFNGRGDGYLIDEETLEKIDLLLEIENNIGHFLGNSQLLLAGLPLIPADCLYTIILEADTWIYGDTLIQKYVNKLKVQEAVWASAQFFRYTFNLATDFAIVQTAFIKSHPNVFKFDRTPEYYVANYVNDVRERFIYIKENMPVNLPRYIKKYPFAPTGRFFTFPAGKMVTHHVETLANGMAEKKFYFNLAADTNYFKINDLHPMGWTKRLLKLFIALSIIIPYKGWFFNHEN